ncbi:MAG: hypothetical protein HS111_34425 [Kofleriaceae bacterium]|nr:hypothetical protein [Kofleriaceae bacterium]MCL4225056.1 hypothetical protein [Myxococcales bacterium]
MPRTSAVGGFGAALPAALVAALGVAVVLLLPACPTVDLGEVPPDPNVCRPDRSYYETEIWPNFLAPTDPVKSCVAQAGCHAAVNGRSALRLDTIEPIDHNRNYTTVTRFLNCNTPASSGLLTKPLTGEDPHGGGDMLTRGNAADDAVIDLFLGWFP